MPVVLVVSVVMLIMTSCSNDSSRPTQTGATTPLADRTQAQTTSTDRIRDAKAAILQFAVGGASHASEGGVGKCERRPNNTIRCLVVRKVRRHWRCGHFSVRNDGRGFAYVSAGAEHRCSANQRFTL
jgi:hypothetical protein